MDKIKKYLILIVILIIVGAIVKSIGFNSDMVFIIGILIIGLLIFIDHKLKFKVIDHISETIAIHFLSIYVLTYIIYFVYAALKN